MLNPMINILETAKDVDEFFEYAKSYPSKYLSIDTETDSLIEKTTNLYGIGLCFDDHEAFYIPWRKKDGTPWYNLQEQESIKLHFGSLCSKHYLLGHNIIFDILVLKNSLSLDLTQYVYADTILMKHCVDEERPFDLKGTAVKYLGPWADKAQKRLYENIKENGGRTTKDHLDMYKADTDVLGDYCCWDVLLVRLLFDVFQKKIIDEGLDKLFYIDETMPLYKEVTIPMKDKGFPIDVKHFERLRDEIQLEIKKLSNEIREEIKDYIVEFEEKTLLKEHPPKKRGNFAKELKRRHGEEQWVKDWLIADDNYIPDPYETIAKDIRRYLWSNKKANQGKEIFNLNSTQQLSWLFFDKLGMKPTSRTEKGAPCLDAETLEELSGQHAFADKIIDYKKLQKLLGTYIIGILERQINGVLHTSMLQFGTTSGRFSSTDPNLMNIPRTKDEDSGLSPLVVHYSNEIKKGFVAPKGYKIIDSDYSQLEPRCYAEASGDPALQQVFKDNLDLYSAIAIASLKDCKEFSARKKDKNYFGIHKAEKRYGFKQIVLAIVYGAEAGQVSYLLDCSKVEAQEIINAYLNAYPGLKKYISDTEVEVVTKGYVKTKFGRVRHLPKAKQIYKEYGWKILNPIFASKNHLKDVRYKFKNMLNNAKNFKIQGVAGHIINRAMLRKVRMIKEHNLDCWIALMVHDEIVEIVREDQAELSARLLKEAMETTTLLSVPLIADPKIADNWKDAK